MSHLRSNLEETRDGLLETFNEIADSNSGPHKRQDMASFAQQILQCEQLIGGNALTLLGVQNKLYKEFEIARHVPAQRKVAAELSQQVFEYQVELNKLAKAGEQILSAEQKLKLPGSSGFLAQP